MRSAKFSYLPEERQTELKNIAKYKFIIVILVSVSITIVIITIMI